MKEKKIILATGTSSGLGKAVISYLYESGYTVYAAARSFDNETISEEGKGSLKKVYMDVTDDKTISSVVDMILKEEKKIDVLVNCAATSMLGAVEDLTIEEFQRVINTNFFGMLRTCKAVLPSMRRRGEGLIINFSSIMGLLAIPYQSAYTSSKFAIEGFTEALSLEVRDFGIKVCMIEPTDHKSGSVKYRPHSEKSEDKSSPYHDSFKTVTKKIEHDEANGSEPIGVAKLVEKIINTKKPKLRYQIGKFDQKLSVLVKKILPGRIFESIIWSYYK